MYRFTASALVALAVTSGSVSAQITNTANGVGNSGSALVSLNEGSTTIVEGQSTDTAFTTPAPVSTTMSTTGSVPTANLFINGQQGNAYAASVIAACSDQTTYAIKCTSADSMDSLDSTACGPDAVPITIVEGANIYSLSFTTASMIAGVQAAATIIESCSLIGTTEADCSETVIAVASTAGTATTISTATANKITGTDYQRFDVALTAGASNTVGAASATCATPSSSPTKNAAPGGRDGQAAGVAVGALGVMGIVAAFFA